MVERVRLERVSGGGSYFTSPKSHLSFYSSGATVLDCVLGGGWVLGRVANIVGDKSTGKTLLAIEGSANFAKSFEKGPIFYREAEAAFDEPYAGELGMPLDRVERLEDGQSFDTVEDFFDDLSDCLRKVRRSKMPGQYLLDSLDALSDKAEMTRDMDQGTYGTQKAKQMSVLFRKLVRQIENTQMSVIIISQIRDKIGAMMGEKTTRTGGRALDFYASQVIKLAHIGTLKKTKHGVQRPTGIRIKAKATKNKIGLPFRECSFDILFGYGIDDVGASVDWLAEVKHLGDAGIDDPKKWLIEANKLSDHEYRDRAVRLRRSVIKTWRGIETEFLPKRRKY